MSGKRSRARGVALQALYAWSLDPKDWEKLKEGIQEYLNKQIDIGYLDKLGPGVIQNVVVIDKRISQYFAEDFKELGLIELNVLRIAFFEQEHCPDIPQNVVINEALELAKNYANEESYKMINRILDKEVRS